VENLFLATYEQTGKSVHTNTYGMREMQCRAFEKADDQYLLIKAPPASGKSRALMFVALEKLHKQLVTRVIVSVPERSIGKSFASTTLSDYGFHSDWIVERKFDLCTPGGDEKKSDAFLSFFDSDAKILLCTHATLRFAYGKVPTSHFNKCLIAIDEFHHVSASAESRLGELIREVMAESSASLVAMTGSYFRGDSVPILSPDTEARFTKVTYNYYEQLNGYDYLKSLGVGFQFYKGKYLSSITEALDITKKTIIHIPSVNAAESTKEKLLEVDHIVDVIGDLEFTDDNGIHHIKAHDGRTLKVADLVNDDRETRERIIGYLRNISRRDDIDIIIALGMAKEGFDWPYCETALTVGYRGSLTEIIQIIGRCTRDTPGKAHAQFINLIAEPDGTREEVVNSVNDMLKAIAASLLMEEVIAPKFNFSGERGGESTVVIKGIKPPSSPRVKEIIDNDIADLKAKILQRPEIQATFPGNVAPEIIHQILVPKIIKDIYPQLTPEETDSLRDYLSVTSIVRPTSIIDKDNRKFINFSNRLVSIDELSLDLIQSINPFQEAFEVLSKALTPRVFKAVQQCIQALKVSMTDDEAKMLWVHINDFYKAHSREPNLDSLDPFEKRMAEALLYLRRLNSEK
jgi:hypothetical protein